MTIKSHLLSFINRQKEKKRDVRANKYKKNNPNKAISIITNNCIGGMLYHDYGLKFLSPTINLYILPNDFIKMCKNLRYYMSIDIVEAQYPEYGSEKVDFPVGKIDDIYVYMKHYRTFSDAVEKWNERKKRIDYNNIYIIMMNMDYHKDIDVNRLDDFASIPYDNKVFMSCESVSDKRFITVKLNGLSGSNRWFEYCNLFSLRHGYDQFDYVGWLDLKKIGIHN